MGDDNGALSLGYMMGQDSGNNNGNDMFGGSGLWGLLALALVFGGGYGGGGLFGGGYGGQSLTRAELYDGFAIQNIDSAVRSVQNGISDATYALNNSITGGFHGVDSAICNLGYNLQSGLNGISRELGDCCCQTQRAIDGLNYNMATQFSGLSNAINTQTRDIIDNQNANAREIMNFMVNSKIETLQAENQGLRLAASQANQNNVIRAAIDASTAEIIRRTGNECPTPAYWVSPPTPVQPPCGGFANYGRDCGC